MTTKYNPRIVTDNLVLCLDAGNTKSYPGSGTTWFDLSGKGNDATINGAQFFNGYFSFDGTSDYGQISDSSDFLFGTGNFTEEAWHKRNGNSTWEAPIVRGEEDSWGGLWINTSGNFYPYHYSESGANITFNTEDSPGTHWIHHVTTTTNTGSAVIIKVYKNGVLQGSQTTSVNGWQPKSTSVGTDLWVGGILGANYWYDGRIVTCRIYKGKALSATEVTQNYNALKGRFGL